MFGEYRLVILQATNKIIKAFQHLRESRAIMLQMWSKADIVSDQNMAHVDTVFRNVPMSANLNSYLTK